MKGTISRLILVAAAVAAVGMALPRAAVAGTITFSGTTPNLTACGCAVDAQAIVTTGNGTITVTLSNLIANEFTVGQALTEFDATLSNTPSSLTMLATSTANDVTVGSGGTATQNGVVLPNWGHSVSGSGLLSVSWFQRTGALDGSSGSASGALLGLTDGSGNYPFANGSMQTGSHNNFTNGDMVFNFSAPGVTALTTLSDAQFVFGTAGGSDSTIPGIPVTPVPEPGSLFLLGTGLLGLALAVKKYALV